MFWGAARRMRLLKRVVSLTSGAIAPRRARDAPIEAQDSRRRREVRCRAKAPPSVALRWRAGDTHPVSVLAPALLLLRGLTQGTNAHKVRRSQ